MTENLGITNVQNLPGDTDFDLVLNDDSVEEESNRQPPPNSQPSKAPVSEPPSGKAPIGEDSNALPRAMSAAAAWTNYERRIY